MEELNYRLIDDASEVAAACERLARHAELGFDTETTSLSPFDGRLRLVQLAAPGEPVYVFDLFALAPSGQAADAPALEPLRRLLASTRPVKIAHNCLAEDMLVSMADGTKVHIAKLVRAKTKGKVLCVDEETGALTTGDIVGWVDGGLRPWGDWLRIRTRGKGVLRVTKDHEILTERGRVRAEHLLVGDKILTSLPDLSRRQRDMLYGSLLGDGSLTKQRTAKARTPHFKVSHSVTQEDYVAVKAAALDGLVSRIRTEKVHYRGYSNSVGGSRLISLITKSDVRLFELYDNCLAEGRRALTPRWLDNLSLPAMAIWYCDDGTLRGGSSAGICVSALGAKGAGTLVEFLRSKGFPTKLWVRPDGQLYVNVVGPRGRGTSEGLKRFWEGVAPYVPVSMRYKLPDAYKPLASDEHWVTPQTQPRAFSDTVVEIAPLLNDAGDRGRYEGRRRRQSRGIRQYCLAVAAHQNFVAGGLAVSNCKFDAKWVRHHLGVELCGDFDSRAENRKEVERGGLFDTLLASQLVSAGEQEDRHSLASVAERYLEQSVDKSQQVSNWGGELSASQLEYAARDAALMLPLRLKLIDALRAASLTRTAQLEFECVVPLAALELAGVYLDQPCWRAKLKEIEKQRNELQELLQEELAEEPAQQSLFGPARASINLDSHVQLTRALKRVLPEGEEIPDSTRNWKLEPLAAKFTVVRRILDYRTLQKTLKFGETLLESINPATGRIHSNFHQIGAPTGRMSCLAGETLVSTDSGLKPIRDIKEGDRVKTSYGFKRVTAAWSNGRRRLYRVLLKDGHSIRATADHRFLTGRADTWKRLDELRPGDSLYVSLKVSGLPGEATLFPINLSTPEARARKPVRLPTSLSVELCELMGLIIADGFLGRRHVRPTKHRRWRSASAAYDRVCIAFDRQDTDLIEKVISYGFKLFGQPFVNVKARTCHVLQLASTKAAEFFAALGLAGNAHTKSVPEIVLSAPPVYRAAFLRGLFEGDGNRSDNSIGLTSVNRRLLSQVQLLLSEFGIHSVIRRRNDTSGFSGSPRFDLKVHRKADVAAFFRHVGFLSRRKNRPFEFAVAITDGIPTPFVIPGAQLYREAVAAGTTTPSRAGLAPFTQFYKGGHIKGESVSKLIDRFGSLPSLKPVVDYLDLQMRPSAIISITPESVEEIYDINVEDVHEFVADGIVVHNCTDPNIQQVPNAFEMRRCFRAPEGRRLIDADYSQIELRILADFTGDRGFVDAFQSGADLHRTTAAQVFNVQKLEDVTKEQRDFAKRLNFGVVYGIGARRFALLTGMKESEAEDLLRRYFSTYRDLDAWLREAGNKAVRERTAPRTVAGRLFRFNFDPEDRQAASLAHRGGKNSPIQGCVSAGTRVFEKSKGYVPIETLNGERVCVWDGRGFANARVAYSGQKQLIKVTLWGGYYIECSPEHKFLTTDVNGRTKWRTPAEFVKGCWVALSNPIPSWSCGLAFPPLEVGSSHNAGKASLADMASPSDLGAWLGRLASDGSLGERQLRLLVAEHEEVLLHEMKRLCGVFGHVSHHVGRGGKGPRRVHGLTISALGLCRQLNAAGVKTRVPDFAWMDGRLLAGYLRGMFDGDGTVTPDGPALCFGQGARHLDWAREIQQALLLLGVRSRINVCADRINVCVLKRDSATFSRRVGFMNPRKQMKVESIVSEQQDGEIYGRAARVKSIEVTDEWVEMYDVVDSDTERFMANGMITHNSSADIIKRAMRLLHDRLKGTGAAIVNVVHDEIVVETEAGSASEIAKVVEGAMCAAGEEYVKAVPVKVEAAVTDEWVK